MVRFSTSYVCQQCGFKTSQYLGKCPECGSWDSLVETVEELQGLKTKTSSSNRSNLLPEIVKLDQLQKQNYPRIKTLIGEFDRVLGGGIVLGSVILVSGDPGIGKSTLLTQLAINVNNVNKEGDVLYVAGEESAQQIKIRSDRIQEGVSLAVVNETDVDVICRLIEAKKPSLAIIDSIQTLETTDLQSPPGSIGQVRESAHRLQHLAKKIDVPMFIVGHVTKEGVVAGPRTLEHLVDGVLSLEGDSANEFRILRSLKNRFGSTDEVGIFEMLETGMKEVLNPSKLFLEQRVKAPGSVVVPVLTGLRPLLVEIQALVTKTYLPVPRRAGSGIDLNRLQVLVAVLTKRLRLPLYDQDIFVNITGGIKISEPAADLGICMAILSSFKDQMVNSKTVFVGEVGLLGEVRAVRGLDKRVSESKKLGFDKTVTFANANSLSQAALQVFANEKSNNPS